MPFAAGNKLLASELNALPQVVAIASTSTVGTITSGTTDTFDAVMGTVQFTADGNTQYRAELMGGNISPSASGHAFLRIRDGGASTPTAASTEIALTPWDCPSGSPGGQAGFYLGNVYTPSAGTHTLGVFTQRDPAGAGTPTFQIANFRQLIVSSAGPV